MNNSLRKTLLSLFTAFICFAVAPHSSAQQSSSTQFIKYKKYLIPINVVPAPETPTGIRGSQGNDDNATISWNPSEGATYYELEWYNPNTGQWELVYSGANTSFNAQNLLYGSNSFRVRACKDKRCSAASGNKAVNIDLIGDIGFNSVGAVQGEGGVSGGSAFYRVPIMVPPGRKGVQPSVSLNYSSSGGNGIAGVGWSLSASSSIHRCSATVAQDGFTASVQYNASRDRLCLNGQRLMKVRGTYGASGAEYRTELDQFARVKQSGSINSGSSSFTVEFKDGTRGYFGATASTRQRDAGRSQIMTWAIARTTDRSGNSVHYDYSNHSQGEHLLNAVHYTGVNNTVGNRHVRFTYETRPDPTSRFLAGGKSRQTKRLKQIKTQYGSATVRTYTLNYGGASASSQRSLLRSVQECAYKGSAKNCLPVTSFNWQEKSPQFKFERLQYKNSNGSSSVIHADKRWLHDVMPRGDFNGDGVRDWPGVYVNAEGEKTGTNNNVISNCYRRANSFTLNCLEADFDSDGRTDSFRRGPEGSFNVRHANSSTWITTNIVWPSTLHSYPIGFSDFNGDGWIDVAFVEADGRSDGKLIIYRHSKRKATPYLTSGRVVVASIPRSSGNSGIGIYTKEYQIHGDVDGNGYADFIEFDTNPNVVRPAGLPYPAKIKKVAASTSGAISFSDFRFTGYKNTATVNANFFHDVNGDGLTDWLALASDGGRIDYKLNNGNGFDNTWRNLGLTLPTRIGTYERRPGEPEVYVYPIMSKVLSMDYNGDGKQDMLVAGAVRASSCHGLEEAAGGGGGGGTPPGEPVPPPGGQPLVLPSAQTNSSSIVWRCDEGLYGSYQERQFSQHKAQINSSILDDSARNYKAIQFVERANGTIGVVAKNTNITASASQAAVVDATGDGLPDIVTVFGCRFPARCEWNTQTGSRSGTVHNAGIGKGAYINRNLGASNGTRYEAHDMMKSVTTGLDVQEHWVYRPLSSDEYDKSNSDFYQTTHRYQENDYDYFHFASSMYVVAERKVSNGVGGLNSTKYRYRGAIYNNKGRGFQGFKSIIVEDDAYGSDPASLDKISRTDYYQKWPMSGIAKQSCTWLAKDNSGNDNPNCSNVISKSVTNTVRNVATSGGARFVAPTKVTSTKYKLAGRSLLSTSTDTTVFDDAGNATTQTMVHEDPYTKVTKTTIDTITLDWSGWWLNKLVKRDVTTSPVQKRHSSSPSIASGTDNTKRITTNYTAFDNTHRLPTDMTVSANDSSLTSRVVTAFNASGLPKRVTTSGTAASGPRVQTMTYSIDGGATASERGYFLQSTTNALGHVSRVTTNPRFGQVTSATDINGLTTVSTYDAFGRVEDVNSPGVPVAKTRYRWCTTICWPGAKYRVSTVRLGSPETITYKDQFNRDVWVGSKSFSNKSYNSVRTAYNIVGQKVFESVPESGGKGLPVGISIKQASIGTTYLGYDAIGRLKGKAVDQPDGSEFVTTYTHNGFKTSITAKGNRIVNGVTVPTTMNLHHIYNGLEQLMETKDAKNGYTRYAYDGSGNPIVMQDAINNKITSRFNAFGHKQWVDDPNMGRKSFTYNGLSEVLTEKDANNDTLNSFTTSLVV